MTEKQLEEGWLRREIEEADRMIEIWRYIENLGSQEVLCRLTPPTPHREPQE